MALLAMACFEDNNLAEVAAYGSAALVAAGARTGTYALEVPRAGAGSEFVNGWTMIIPDTEEIYMQWAVKLTTTGASQEYKIVRWLDSLGIILGGFKYTSADEFKVYIGDFVTLVGTTPAISTSYTLFEMYLKIAGIGGRIVIKMNGVTVVDYTGDTKGSGFLGVKQFNHGNVSNNTYVNTLTFDDILIFDTTGTAFNSWPMGIKIHKLAAPIANGNYHAWTPSAGDNYECIDEIPPTMTDNLTGVAGNKDSYAFGDAPGVLGIAAVVTSFWGQGGGSIKRLCRSGGSDYLSNAFNLSGAFNRVFDVMSEKPGGGGWDVTTLNAAEFGMEKQ